MPKNITQLNVFIGCPSDVESDVQYVISEIENSNNAKYQFKYLYWKNSAHSDIGAGTAQDAINRQLLLDSDIYIFLLHGRIGYPDKSNKTGLEQELELALERKKSIPGIKIGIYFKTADFRYDADIEQISLLRKFKKRTEELGLYKEYNSSESLVKSIRQFLSNVDFEDKSNNSVSTKDIIEPDEQEEPLGILDYELLMENALEEAGNLLENIGDAHAKTSLEIDKFNRKIKYIDPAILSAKERHSLTETISEAFEDLLNELLPQSNDFESNIKQGFDSAIIVLNESKYDSQDDLMKSMSITMQTKDSVDSLLESMTDMRQQLARIPMLTQRLRKSWRNLNAYYDKLESTLSWASYSCERVITRIEERLKK